MCIDAQIQIGRQPQKSAAANAANLLERFLGGAKLYSQFAPPNS